MNYLLFTLFIGVGATAVMDLWGLARKPLLGIAPPNYALVGRWIAYMTQGQFRHDSIAASARVRGEHILGWTAHYLTGIAFAALLIGIWGFAWVQNPTIGPALAIGIGSVAAPFLLMQPGMGAGVAASRTPRPASARLQSLVTHAVFGLGLYATGQAVHLVCSL
jgi:polyferredoxin